MTDGTKALLLDLRSARHEPLCSEAADAIARLSRDRDALAERCEKLREALRRHAIVERYCHCCGQICQDGYEPEWHFKGCLAAPKDAP